MYKVYLVVKGLVSVQDKLSLVEIVIGPENIQQSNMSAFRLKKARPWLIEQSKAMMACLV